MLLGDTESVIVTRYLSSKFESGGCLWKDTLVKLQFTLAAMDQDVATLPVLARLESM